MNMNFTLKAIAAVAVAAAFIASAPISARAEEHDWTGAYVGGNIGAGMSSGHIDDADCFYCTSSVFSERLLQAGVDGGYQKQFGSAVLGLGAEINLGSQDHKGDLDGDHLRAQSKITWTGALLGRAGVAVRNALVYITAGPAMARVSASETNTSAGVSGFTAASFTKWQPGFKTGVGLEYMVAPRLSVQAQYSALTVADRTEYGATAQNFAGRIVFSNAQTVATVGANWHF